MRVYGSEGIFMVYSREDDNGGHDFGILWVRASYGWICATLLSVVVDEMTTKTSRKRSTARVMLPEDSGQPRE